MTTINDDDLYLAEDGSYEYQDQPFTGIARQYRRDGTLLSEIAYVNGLQEGLARWWYPSGELNGEEYFVRNSRHGPSREWYPDGRLKRDTLYEHAIVVREQKWDENGKLVRDFTLTEDNPLFQILQGFRKVYGTPPSH
jgi:antitoxin component YwqK of YwqJK toxin-antitoxin module